MSILFITPQIETLVNKSFLASDDDLISIGFLLSNQKHMFKYDKPKYNKEKKTSPFNIVFTPEVEILTDQALQYFEKTGNDDRHTYLDIGRIIISGFSYKGKPIPFGGTEYTTFKYDKPKYTIPFGQKESISLTPQIIELINDGADYVKKYQASSESICFEIGHILINQKIWQLKEEEDRKRQELNNLLADLHLSGLNIDRINKIVSEQKNKGKNRHQKYNEHKNKRSEELKYATPEQEKKELNDLFLKVDANEMKEVKDAHDEFNYIRQKNNGTLQDKRESRRQRKIERQREREIWPFYNTELKVDENLSYFDPNVQILPLYETNDEKIKQDESTLDYFTRLRKEEEHKISNSEPFSKEELEVINNRVTNVLG